MYFSSNKMEQEESNNVSDIYQAKQEILLEKIGDGDSKIPLEKDNDKQFEENDKEESTVEKTIRDDVGKFLSAENEKIPNNIKQEYKTLDDTELFIYDKIKKRKEIAPKMVFEEIKLEKSGIERRLEDSDKILSELIQLGTELVTNVKVANEKREVARRNNEAVKRKSLLQELQDESVEAMIKFDAITSKWPELQKIKEPMSLYEELQIQKKRMAELLEQKDDLIQKCKLEVDRANELYYNDIERQNSDICSLVERIDNQIQLVKKAYNDHLELLQDTIEIEHKKMAEKASKEWETLHLKWMENEEIHMKNARIKEELFEKEIERIQLENEEIIRATKTRLENDTQSLQRELRQAKSNILLNSEKFSYNYQVLQKRDEENSVIRTQQKIRLNKLHNTIYQLNKKLEEKETQTQHKIKQTRKEITQLYRNIENLEVKSNTITTNDMRKNLAVWEVQDKEARTLISEILQIDKILCEEELGVDWMPPPDDLFPSLQQFCEEKGIKLEDSKIIQVEGATQQENKTDEQKLIDTKLLQHILSKIADRTGFLLEDKLFEILEPYTEKEKTLVKIENIFLALGINNIKDMESMIEYFLPYSWCPNCTPSGISKDIINKKIEMDFKKDFCSNSDVDGEAALNSHITEQENKMIISIKECDNHNLVIEPSLILTGLKNFLQKKVQENQNETSKEKQRRSVSAMKKQMIKILCQMSKEDIEKYWFKYLLLISKEKKDIWRHLEKGLKYYLKVLKERAKLNTECEQLRRQNMELHYLLCNYENDKPKDLENKTDF